MHQSPQVSFILSKLFCYTPPLRYLADSTQSDVLSHPQDAVGGCADCCARRRTWRRRVLSCVIESRFPLSLLVPVPHHIQGTHACTLSVPLLLSLTSSLYSRLSLGTRHIQACMYISCF